MVEHFTAFVVPAANLLCYLCFLFQRGWSSRVWVVCHISLRIHQLSILFFCFSLWSHSGDDVSLDSSHSISRAVLHKSLVVLHNWGWEVETQRPKWQFGLSAALCIPLICVSSSIKTFIYSCTSILSSPLWLCYCTHSLKKQNKKHISKKESVITSRLL